MDLQEIHASLQKIHVDLRKIHPDLPKIHVGLREIHAHPRSIGEISGNSWGLARTQVALRISNDMIRIRMS